MAKLTIITGLPGSGKTTEAKSILSKDETYETKHFENDQFHIIKGKYSYDSDLVKYAHGLCKCQAAMWLNRGKDVVVSNCFISSFSLVDYAEIAMKTSSSVEIIEMTGDYGSTHNVPESVIQDMSNGWVGEKEKSDIFAGIDGFTYTVM